MFTESELVRPLRAPGERFRQYADALGELDRPALFENRPCYRLLDVAWTEASGRMTFGLGQYFDVINVCEAAAHELAHVEMTQPDRKPEIESLPFRTLIGDPLELSRRRVMPAISTLTVRKESASHLDSIVLHYRDPARVATGGGLYQVAPVGMFQPAGGAEDADFDLWRCMAREFSEELTGAAEHDGVDYATWPSYRALEQARDEGRCRAYCLGLGVDPLTLVTDILAVTVFEAEIFDEVFGEVVATHGEGRTLVEHTGSGATSRIPFTEDSVKRFVRAEPMQPAGAAVLALAWRHRQALLSH